MIIVLEWNIYITATLLDMLCTLSLGVSMSSSQIKKQWLGDIKLIATETQFCHIPRQMGWGVGVGCMSVASANFHGATTPPQPISSYQQEVSECRVGKRCAQLILRWGPVSLSQSTTRWPPKRDVRHYIKLRWANSANRGPNSASICFWK